MARRKKQKDKQKQKKRKYYAELRLDIKHYPTTMKEVLEALFPKHREYSEFAYFLAKKARDDSWHVKDWIKVILEFLLEYSKIYNIGISPEEISELLALYEKYDEKYSRTERNEYMRKEAKARGLDIYTWYYKYKSILKRLMRIGLIYKKNDFYSTSKEFLRMIRAIEEALEDFYMRKDEEGWMLR